MNKGRKEKNGIIFGKFYPLHNGHVDFIQKASGYVDNLYVVVCTDTERDSRLFSESGMLKMPTEKDRIKFVSETFRNQEKIKVLHLSEEGIPAYPNGWTGWTSRVKELLSDKEIKIDIIFTNEPQDVRNYEENFVNSGESQMFSDGLEIMTIDISRSSFHISATEIRKNPYRNWFFMPRSVRKFFHVDIFVYYSGSYTEEFENLMEKLKNYYNSGYVRFKDRNSRVLKKGCDISIFFVDSFLKKEKTLKRASRELDIDFGSEKTNFRVLNLESGDMKNEILGETELYNLAVETINSYIG